MKTLELFCGSKSFTKYMRKNFSVDSLTLDINDTYQPDILIDILDWDYTEQEAPDILWISPDCRSFSNQAYGTYQRRHSDMMPLTETAILGDKLLEKSIEIINHFLKKNPKMVWLMENPRGTMFRSPILKKIPHYQNSTRYCDYEPNGRTKKTDIFSNKKLDLKNSPGLYGKIKTCNGRPMKNGSRKGAKSYSGIGGWNGSAILKGEVPDKLLEEIISQCCQ